MLHAITFCSMTLSMRLCLKQSLPSAGAIPRVRSIHRNWTASFIVQNVCYKINFHLYRLSNHAARISSRYVLDCTRKLETGQSSLASIIILVVLDKVTCGAIIKSDEVLRKLFVFCYKHSFCFITKKSIKCWEELKFKTRNNIVCPFYLSITTLNSWKHLYMSPRVIYNCFSLAQLWSSVTYFLYKFV